MSSVISYVRIANNKVIKDGRVVHSYHNLDDLYEMMGLNYPRFYKMDNLSKAGFLAAELLIDQTKDAATSVVLSNSSSSNDTDLRYSQTMKEQASPSLFVYTLPNIAIGEICIRHGFKGESIFFVSPQFDTQWMTDYVQTVLTENTGPCIAGWVEVIEGRADVLLYLADRSNGNLPHTPTNISEIYHLWNS